MTVFRDGNLTADNVRCPVQAPSPPAAERALALALVRIEEALAQADRFRRHLDQLVIGDIGDRLLEVIRIGGVSRTASSLRGGADIGELLALDRVDVEIVAAACARR